MFLKGLGIFSILALFNHERIINWVVGKDVLQTKSTAKLNSAVTKPIPASNQLHSQHNTFNIYQVRDTTYRPDTLKGPNP